MVMTRRKSNLNLCRRKRSRIQPEVDQPTISPTKSPSVKKLKQCKSSFLIKIKSPAKNIKFHPISTTEEISTKSPVDLSKGHDRGLTGPCIRLFADQLQNDMLHEIEHEIEDPPKNDKLQELIALAPAVLTVLNQNNCADSIVKFFKVVSEGKFPLDNIAFLLWIELVNFFSTSNTCEMRYMDSTKKFWKLGWILFGSKFVRFMMGFKNTSQITFGETVQGSFNPTEADINFAVPDIKVLRNFQPYNSTKNNIREPGIFTDIMHDIANSLQDTSACLSFDGKKLKQGLSGTHGDINLLGFEDGVSLYEKQKKLEAELSMVYEIIGEIQVNVKMVGLNDIPQAMKADIVSVLQEVLKLLGLTAKSLRKIKDKKLYAKAKFIERSAPGSDWKNGQYVYVISSINAFLYEIDSFFWHYDITLEKLLSVLSSLNGCNSMYIGGYHFKLDDHQNFKPLADIETDDTRLVKQRSSKWFKIRQTAKVTGSSIYAALGLNGLKKMQDHFDQVVCHVPPKERSAEVQSFLDYGTNHEIYAVATLVGKILPSLYPGLVYYEEGCIAIQYEEQNFMVVSPDGSLRSENGTNDICGIEIKW